MQGHQRVTTQQNMNTECLHFQTKNCHNHKFKALERVENEEEKQGGERKEREGGISRSSLDPWPSHRPVFDHF